MMKTAAAYVRVSTDHQTELSPDSQIKQIYNYAKSHHLIVPPEFIFSDEGISGKHTKNREAFNQMIAMAKQHRNPLMLSWCGSLVDLLAIEKTAFSISPCCENNWELR